MYWQYKSLNHVGFTWESSHEGVELCSNQQFQAEMEDAQVEW
jgi:hypothetical protein